LTIPSACPVRVASCWPVWASQTRAVLSAPPVRTCRPSGLHATLQISFACPLRIAFSWPVAASQSRAVLSPLPLRMRRPSGLHAAPWIFRVPLEQALLLARLGVPDPCRLVPPPRQDAPAVGTPRHPGDRLRVPREGGLLLAAPGVPDPRRKVLASREDAR